MNGAEQLRAAGREVSALASNLRALCGDDDQALVDTLDGETSAVETARRVLRWVDEQGAMSEAVKKLADEYAQRAKLLKDRAHGGRAALLQFMQEIGAKTMPLPEATLSVTQGQPQVAGEPDVAALPKHLLRLKAEPDMAAIKAELQAGRAVPGCSLSNAGPSLQIRKR
jgi:hypothetical protein